MYFEPHSEPVLYTVLYVRVLKHAARDAFWEF